MQSSKHVEHTIDQFGKIMSKMSVNLTIAQSEEKKSTFGVLKNINSKQVTTKFTEVCAIAGLAQ